MDINKDVHWSIPTLFKLFELKIKFFDDALLNLVQMKLQTIYIVEELRQI